MIYRLTGQARQELFEIWQYIAGDNERAADRFIDLLLHHFQVLGEHPYAGRSRDDLRKGYRSFPVGQYVIFYRIHSPGVQIVHIIHGKRDIDDLLRG
jgi:toxin ParE1/3/4